MKRADLRLPIGIVGFGAEGEATLAYLTNQGHLALHVFDKTDVRERVRKINSAAVVHCQAGYLNDLSKMRTVIRSAGVPPSELGSFSPSIEVFTPTGIFFENCPAPIIGITGTKGKGTTALLITHILASHFKNKHIHLLGNIGNASLWALAQIKADDLVVYELSSFQLIDLKRSPHVAVVLEVGADHLDWHKDIREYHAAKRAIVEFQTKNDYAVINADYLHSLAFALYGKGKTWWFSRRKAVEPGVFADERQIAVLTQGVKRAIMPRSELKLLGAHNLENVCAAAAVGAIYHVPPDEIRAALNAFRGLEHRLEEVAEVRGILFINDSYATTPAATIAAVQSFSPPMVLLMGGSSKGTSYAPLARAIAEHSVRAVVTFGATGPQVTQALKAARFRGTVVPGGTTMNTIVNTALAQARAGDVVLLSPASASFGLFKNATDRGHQFKDAVHALN